MQVFAWLREVFRMREPELCRSRRKASGQRYFAYDLTSITSAGSACITRQRILGSLVAGSPQPSFAAPLAGPASQASEPAGQRWPSLRMSRMPPAGGWCILLRMGARAWTQLPIAGRALAQGQGFILVFPLLRKPLVLLFSDTTNQPFNLPK